MLDPLSRKIVIYASTTRPRDVRRFIPASSLALLPLLSAHLPLPVVFQVWSTRGAIDITVRANDAKLAEAAVAFAKSAVAP